MKTLERNSESLDRALNSRAASNYGAILIGFAAKGLLEGDIEPRVNVFTYNAWQALGRQVKRGEKGVKIQTWIKGQKENKTSGATDYFSYPKMTTVLHITQTDKMEG